MGGCYGADCTAGKMIIMEVLGHRVVIIELATGPPTEISLVSEVKIYIPLASWILSRTLKDALM